MIVKSTAVCVTSLTVILSTQEWFEFQLLAAIIITDSCWTVAYIKSKNKISHRCLGFYLWVIAMIQLAESKFMYLGHRIIPLLHPVIWHQTRDEPHQCFPTQSWASGWTGSTYEECVCASLLYFAQPLAWNNYGPSQSVPGKTGLKQETGPAQCYESSHYYHMKW